MSNKELLKDSLIFLVGAAIGGVGTWLATKTYYKKFAEKEIEESREWYKNRIKEHEVTPEEFEEATGVSTDELKDELREKRALARKNRNKPDIVDYTTFYKPDGKRPSVETSLAEMEHPKDSDEDEMYGEDGKLVDDEFSEPDPIADDHEEENYLAGKRMYEEDKRNAKRDPYIIEEAEFYSDQNRNSQVSVFYYTENDCLVDEKDEYMENRELVIGNALDDGEFDESGVMYVRNPRTRTDYEITRVESAWIRE